jgi:Domain of unknown function (DUF4232)
MRFRASTGIAVSIAAAGLAVAGCTSGNSGSPSGASSGSPAASTGSSATASGPSASPSAQAAGGGSTCQPASLSFALGARSGSSTQRTQTVDLSNKGSSACTLAGFPGVDLVGAAQGQQNFTWSLTRQSASYSTVTLTPGATAHFSVVYLPGTAGGSGSMSVFKMVITPPNDFTQAEVTWSQAVVLQDGATHPGTYITPVVPGS